MYEDVHSVHYLVIKDLKVQYFFLFFKGITIELNMKMSRAKKDQIICGMPSCTHIL